MRGTGGNPCGCEAGLIPLETRPPVGGRQLHTERSLSLAGFTLLELLLSVALISLIVGIGVPIYQNVQTSNDIRITLLLFRENARRAQIASQAMNGDSTWGVKVTTGTITLFRGGSFATRVTSSDELSDISPNVLISGISEIVFSKLTGAPQVVGTTTFRDLAGRSSTISINAKGTLDY